jgi:DNA-directed RNA polymerase subunit E'
MDDHIDVDVDNQRLIGKESRRDVKLGNDVRARIVTVSVNERNPRESKIGLTMRQNGLGKVEWFEEDFGAEAAE